MIITVIAPFGFCEGVQKALQFAKKARQENPNAPVYLIGGIVHNESVLQKLEKDNFRVIAGTFSEIEGKLRMLPPKSIIVFSAHGHAPAWDEIALKNHLIVYDSTCCYVKMNATLIRQAVVDGFDVAYIGKDGHAESEAAIAINSKKVHLITTGEKEFVLSSQWKGPYVVSQTTMDSQSIIECETRIRARFPSAVFAAKICHSTDERQRAIAVSPQSIDGFVILGSRQSNNTKELAKVATVTHPNARVILALNVDELKEKNLSGIKHLALASGASTPLEDFFEVKKYLLNISNNK